MLQIRQSVKSLALILPFVLICNASMAKTTGVLQLNANGNKDGNNLTLLNTMPDRHDVLFNMNCDDSGGFAIVLDFGLGRKWDVAGENVTFTLKNNKRTDIHMLEKEKFLVLGGRKAKDAMFLILGSDSVTFTGPANATAMFILSEVSEKVQRFRQSCGF